METRACTAKEVNDLLGNGWIIYQVAGNEDDMAVLMRNLYSGEGLKAIITTKA